MKLKNYKIQLLSGSFLVMLTVLTVLMARYGEHLPSSSSLFNNAHIMVALGMRQPHMM
jgi:hypothetical protein